MKRRDDEKFLRKIDKHFNYFSAEWASTPLIVFEEGTSIEDNWIKKLKNFKQLKQTETISKIFDMVKNAPLKEFLFLNVRSQRSATDFDNYGKFVYFDILEHFSDMRLDDAENKNFKEGIFLQLPIFEADQVIQFILLDNGNMLINSTGEYKKNFISLIDLLTESKRDTLAVVLLAYVVQMVTMFQTIDETDLYPVSVKNELRTAHKKHNKKPWTREDLVTIRFLNKFPSVKNESKGGHHASPIPHQRKGGKYHLNNPCFKNHPKYKSFVYRKAAWIGDKEKAINGVVYKVL